MSKRVRKILLTGKKPKLRSKPKLRVVWGLPTIDPHVFSLWKSLEELREHVMRSMGVPPDLLR